MSLILAPSFLMGPESGSPQRLDCSSREVFWLSYPSHSFGSAILGGTAQHPCLSCHARPAVASHHCTDFGYRRTQESWLRVGRGRKSVGSSDRPACPYAT